MKLSIATLMLLTCSSAITVSSQSGGDLRIETSVIASGGTSSSDDFRIVGTIGQPVAGQASNGGPYRISSGFWQSAALIPTSAIVTISGRVTALSGQPISGVTVSLTDTDGRVQKAVSNPFGYYGFDSVPSGKVYIISAAHRRFYFNAQAILVNESMLEIVISALQ